MGVDATSGGQYRLVPETVNVTLKPLPPLPSQPQPVLQEPEPEKAKGLSAELEDLEQMKREGTITAKEYRILRKKMINKY